jgi:hypothetical protein
VLYCYCYRPDIKSIAEPKLPTLSAAQFIQAIRCSTDPEARVRFPAPPKKKVVGLERGPLSLLSTTEELLDRKITAPV